MHPIRNFTVFTNIFVLYWYHFLLMYPGLTFHFHLFSRTSSICHQILTNPFTFSSIPSKPIFSKRHISLIYNTSIPEQDFFRQKSSTTPSFGMVSHFNCFYIFLYILVPLFSSIALTLYTAAKDIYAVRVTYFILLKTKTLMHKKK